ncbi:MAG: zinc ribbon domain-containing protein [Planctomycetota bacterium]
MPTYDYVCHACHHAFELFQQMSDPVKRKCPSCGALKLERLIGTGSGVLFKGSGFYETDYRSSSYQKGAEAEKKSSESSSSSDSSSSSSTSPKKSADSGSTSSSGSSSSSD